MVITMLGLDRANRQINIYTNPYWFKDNIYIGTILNTKEEYPVYKNDAYFYNGSVKDLIKEIRDIGDNMHSILLQRSDKMTIGMNVLNGYCSILSVQIHSMFVFFEDDIKVMDNMTIRKDISDGAYHISSSFCEKDKKYYQNNIPKGKSYDDVIDALSVLKKASSESIADYIGIDRNRVSGRLTEMERAGIVKRDGYTKSKHGVTVITWVRC